MRESGVLLRVHCHPSMEWMFYKKHMSLWISEKGRTEELADTAFRSNRIRRFALSVLFNVLPGILFLSVMKN